MSSRKVEGYWMWYLDNVRILVHRALTEDEVRSTMKAYQSGIPFQTQAKELMK